MITQERVDQIQEIKNEIGWAWDTVASRLGWSPHQMRQVRTLKVPVADEHIAYLAAVRAAIDAIPVPGPEVIMPQPELPQDVRVMMLDDIATKLVEEYFALDGEGATSEEIAGARYMVGRLALRCGVEDEVRAAIKQREAPPAAPSPPPAIGRVRDVEVDEMPLRRVPTVPNPFLRTRVPMED